MNIIQRAGAILVAAVVLLAAAPTAAAPLPTQTAILTIPDPTSADEFGSAVAISGDTLVISSPFHAARFALGTVYVYIRSGQGWALQQELTQPDAIQGGRFGLTVAIDGDTLAVGDPGRGPLQGQGAIYVFTRSNGVWTPSATLTAADGAFSDGLGGSALALSGGYIAAGAPLKNLDQGEVYIFANTGGTWSQTAAFTADSIAQFGSALTLSATTLAIADRASAIHIYSLAGGQPTLQATLGDPNPAGTKEFGSSVSLSGDTLLALAGGGLNNVGRQVPGAAYVYTRSASVWSAPSVVLTTNGFLFEGGAAISGDVAVVGVPGSFSPGIDEGSAYVLTRSNAVWTSAAIGASDSQAGDEFGLTAAVDGQTVVIGAPFASGSSGEVYVFQIPSLNQPPPLSNAWVSGLGSDTNACTLAAPCQTFTAALAQTQSGGEVDCLDSADFGPLVISKSITIDCKAHTAGVMVAANSGVFINVGPNDHVQLRGLDIAGLGAAAHSPNGVDMAGAGNLAIIDCHIHDFQNNGGANGVALTGTGHIAITGSLLNANDIGVNIEPGVGAGSYSVTIDHTVIEANLTAGVRLGAANTIAVLSNDTITGQPIAIQNPVAGQVISYRNNLIRNAGAPTQTLPRQ